MNILALKSGLVIILLSLAGAGQAAYYVYQKLDGSRFITDRLQFNQAFKLVRKSRQIDGMGKHVNSDFAILPAITHRKFDGLIEEVAIRHHMDPALVKAVVHTESYFNPNATSKTGASGLMQLMPKTARKYGVYDLYSPRQNLEAGVKHLHYLLRRYKNRLSYALAAYNAGERAVRYYNGIPPYRETRRYIRKVIHFQSYYRNIRKF